jgi:hypothetical protein
MSTSITTSLQQDELAVLMRRERIYYTGESSTSSSSIDSNDWVVDMRLRDTMILWMYNGTLVTCVCVCDEVVVCVLVYAFVTDGRNKHQRS